MHTPYFGNPNREPSVIKHDLKVLVAHVKLTHAFKEAWLLLQNGTVCVIYGAMKIINEDHPYSKHDLLSVCQNGRKVSP